MRVRLRVQPGDFGDIEFESFTGMVAVLEGMSKSLTNNDWIAGDLTRDELEEALSEVGRLKKIFMGHVHHDSDDYRAIRTGDNNGEITLAYRPSPMHLTADDGLV